MTHSIEFDYVIRNHDLNLTLALLKTILQNESPSASVAVRPVDDKSLAEATEAIGTALLFSSYLNRSFATAITEALPRCACSERKRK